MRLFTAPKTAATSIHRKKEFNLSKLPTKKQIQKKKILFSAAALVGVFLVVAFYLIMTQSGHWLVQDDEFDHVKWVVILDGQSADMERNDYVAELFANGKADSVLMLGRRIFRNKFNTEFYLDDFMRQGDFDSNTVFIARHDDPSSISEAYTIIPWLKKHHADTVLLITGASSTYRVKNIFETLSGESPVYLTKDIHHYFYNSDSWFTNRELIKEWIRGWLALAGSYVDLFAADTLTAADSFYYKPIVSAKEYDVEKNPIVDLQSLLPKVQEKISEPDTAKADTVKVDTTEKVATKQDSVAVVDSAKAK